MTNTSKAKCHFLLGNRVVANKAIACFFVLLIVAPIFSQNQRISIKGKDISIKSVFDQIEVQTKLTIAYDESILDVRQRIKGEIKATRLDSVLTDLLKDTDFEFLFQDKHIVIRKNIADIDNSSNLQPASERNNKTVVGKIVSAETDEPIIGAIVVEKGTTNGVPTDMDGNFRLIVADNAMLQISSIGYIKREINTSGQTNITISLRSDENLLDEVIVIGYGTQRKVDVTGSISSVNTKDLGRVVTNNAGQALQGLASGVNVRNYGLPGNNSKISIRGVTSFGDISPLIIVDGIEQNLDNISAQDIESIQVLKDARVASIYGVRGSNGVILVTTKKGKLGKPKVSYSGQGGVTFPLPGNVFHMLNSEEYMHVLNIGQPGNEIFKNGMPDYLYSSPILSGVAFEGDPAIDPSRYFFENPNKGNNYLIQKVNKEGTDWFHEAFKRAYFQEHNVSVAGGEEYSRYYFSLGYLDQKGTLVETFLKRYSARVNTEFNIGKYIKVGENLNVFYNSFLPFSTGVNYGGIASLYKMLPIIPLHDIMGNWGGTWIGTELGSEENVVANLHRNAPKSDYDSYNIVGNLYAEASILKDFILKTSLGLNYWNNRNQVFSSAQAENGERHAQPNVLNLSSSQGTVITFSNTLNYKKIFGGKHHVDALIGIESIEKQSKGITGQSKDYDIIDDSYLLLQLGNEGSPATSSLSKSTMLSYFGRADYNYEDKYLFGITVRRDGSSLFGPQNRWGTFPSFSVGWRVSQESFMEHITWLNDLKLRLSYGVLGSQNNVAAANQFSTFNASLYTTSYDIAGTSNSVIQGMAKNRIGNYLTGWEEDIVQNIGLDVSLLNNTLDFQFDWYKKTINGLLLTEPLPSVITALVTSPTINIGDIQNTGIDFTARYRFNIDRVNNSISLNFSRYKNKIKKLPDPGYFGENYRNQVGHPTGMFYGYKITGIFQNQYEIDIAAEQDGAQPGRFRYEDINKDDKITTEDRQFLGSPHPNFTYGIVLSSQYKGFDIYAQFYGVHGNTIYNSTRISTDFFQDNVSANKSRRIMNAWTPDNRNTDVPKIENARSFSTIDAFNDYALEDGSYFRMKLLSLGYTVDSKSRFMKYLGVSNLRIAVSLNNVFTLTNYSGVDPDIAAGSPSSFGIDVATYPTNERKLTLGLNITF